MSGSEPCAATDSQPSDRAGVPRRFAFLVHPRNKADIENNTTVGQDDRARAVRDVAPVVLGELTYAGSPGEVIAVPLTTAQMAKLPRRYVREMVLAAVRLAEKRGAQVVGLGAMTSVVTRGGQTLIGEVSCVVTNGNALTAAIVARQTRDAAARYGEDARIAVLGGAGSVGLCVAQLLAGLPFRELAIFGRSPLSLSQAVDKLSATSRAKVLATRELNDVLDADVIVVATAGPGALLDLKDVAAGSTVLDVSEPSNVQPLHGDAGPTLVRAGLVELEGVDLSLIAPGLAPGRAYACLAETILYALDEDVPEHHVGQPEPERALALGARADKTGMAIAV